MEVKRVILSRTDSIGDVILTLPMAGLLKKIYPAVHLIFLGSSYTRDIIECSSNIDLFLDWTMIQKEDPETQIKTLQGLNADAIIHVFPGKEIARLAKAAKIPFRIGTTGRIYHYLYCNKLVPLTRRCSLLHEAQLNIKLLQPFGVINTLPLNELPPYFGFRNAQTIGPEVSKYLDKTKFNLILHPKSKGSAREWGVVNFSKLINLLPADRFNIFITGTLDEGLKVKRELIDPFPGVIDLTGKLTLSELIGFIAAADGLVAASTGPLHIAAALGKFALGLYPPIKPMHPGRWAPVGLKADFLVMDKKCSKCRNGVHCACLEEITPEWVKSKLMSWLNG